MVREPLSQAERDRGEHLGQLLRQARGPRSMADIAQQAGISTETLRKIETGRIPTSAFFTVAALAAALDLSLDVLIDALDTEQDSGHDADRTRPARTLT